jgi:O-antigen ligase
VGNVAFFFLCLFLAFVPCEEMGALQDFPSISRLFGLMLLVAAILALLSGARIRKPPLPFYIMCVYVIWYLLSVLWGVDEYVVLGRVVTMVSLLIFVWLIWEFASTLDRQMWLMRSFVFGLIAPVAMQFTAFRAGEADGGRFTGGGNDLNYLAELLGIGAIFCTYLIVVIHRRTGRLAWRYLALMPVFAIAISLAGSRTGFVALLAAGACILYILQSRSRWLGVLFLTIAAGIAVAIPFVVPEASMNRIIQDTGFSEENLGPRARIWRSSVIVIKEHPILGVGADCSQFVLGEHFRVCHNVALSVQLELGAIGLAIFLLLLLSLLSSILKMAKFERVMWLTIAMTWGLFSMTLSQEYLKLTWFLFGLVMVQSQSSHECAMEAARRNAMAQNGNRRRIVGNPRGKHFPR